MGERRLTFHTSNRLDILAERLAEVLAAAPLAPERDEIVVVQSQGMARWLALALASHHGVCAGTATPFPQTFVHSLADALGDGPSAPSHEKSAFGRTALTWRIYADMAAWPDDAAFAPAARYLADDADGRKRYQLARRLADLFDNYQLFRPDLLLSWQKDATALPAGLADRRETAAWQARLWNRLVDSSDEASLASRLTSLTGKLETGDPQQMVAALPARVSVFGVSTLPPVFIDLLAALSRSIPVTLYFVSPTREYWADVRSAREAERIRDRVAASGSDESDAHVEEGNPLLGSLGTQGREFFSLLQEADRDGTAWQPLRFHEPGAGAPRPSVLHAVQADVLDLRSEDDDGDAAAPDDDSIVVDCCHSPMREMEVLRDRILDAFERDADLRPDDVLVLVTDIARYAPYVEAVFGVQEPGVPTIPFSIADRSPVDEALPIKAVLRLLEVAAGRFEAGNVIDLMELDIVRRRFGIGADELRLLRDWAGLTNIRWGIDAGWREREVGVEHMEANSWKSGIDRLLMGYAVGECESLVGGIAPSAAAAAADADLLGRFTAFAETLFSEQRSLRTPARAAAWAANIRRACDLFLSPEPDDEAALATLRAAVDDLALHAQRSGLDEPLSPAVLRAWLDDALADDSKGHGFINGRVTFCALKPMRTIPFRIICIAGLGDREFPRRDRPAGFDLIAADARPGDRSLRDDDRYLFLETVLAAGERLVLTYEGRSQTDTAERAPSVVLSELLDHLDRRCARDAEGKGAGARTVVTQAMHPFDTRYFGDEEQGLFSYSKEYRAVAEAAGDVSLRAECPALSELDAPAELKISPADLAELWVNPSKAYLERALGIRLRDRAVDEEDSEPFELDGLQRYQLKQGMLGRRIALHASADASARPDADELARQELIWMRACGELPVGGFGAAAHADLTRAVDELADRIGEVRASVAEPVDLRGPGWRLAGTVDLPTSASGDRLRYRPAALKAVDYVRAWVAHVILNAAAVQGGEQGRRQAAVRSLALHGVDATVVLRPPDRPREILDDLVSGYRAGMTRPLPLFPQTAYEYVSALLKRAGGSARGAQAPLERVMRQAWQGNDFTSNADSRDAHIALCFRDIDPLARFDDELRELAERLWLPLLAHVEHVRKVRK